MAIESSSILWKIKRLSSMSLSEIVNRIIRTLKLKFLGIQIKYRIIKFYDFNKVLKQDDFPINSLEFDPQINKLISEADNYLLHKWFYFGSYGIQENNFNWHKDYINNISASKKYSFSINHREYDEVGNIKVIWEKNRHHHLTIMSIAFFLTKDEKYAKEVTDQIKNWIKENPFLIGVNWTHPLENAIRLISWIYCERLLRGSVNYDVLFNKESIFWQSVYEHQKFIVKTYSTGSSANNHLIGEMAGLFISSLQWPFFPESKKWIKFSKNILEKEILKQSFPSGVNREMAFGYQIFVYEFYLLAFLDSKNHNNMLSENFTKYLAKNASVISELTKNYMGIPNYGDGDEGMVIQLQDIKGDRISWLMEVTKSLFPELNLLLTHNTLPAALLGYPTSINSLSVNNETESMGYDDAGIYILNKKAQDLNISCLFKAGPFGFGSIAAHSHADSLNIALNINGIPFFVDSGTYCYHTDLEYRKYFRSTKAHNTLCINNMDQSEQIGPFLWGKKAKTHVDKHSSSDNTIKAHHTGYKHLGITHSRELRLTDRLMVTDEISGQGEHLLDFRFHLHPEVEIIENDKNSIVVKNNNFQLKIKNQLGFPLKVISESNDGGWYSPQFNVKIPTTTLSYQKKVSLPIKQIFSIEFKRIT